jgi:hypothetical protein
MKKLILLLSVALLGVACQQEHDLEIHKGLYAFCGASGAEPTGKTIIVQGVEFEEGCAICPVLTGPSVSNLAMTGLSPSWGEVLGNKGGFSTKDNFQYPGYDGSTRWDGKSVWSLYWYFDTTSTVPQYNPATQEWEMMQPNNRAFTVNTQYPDSSESNMFCMPCQIIDTTDTGIILAKCYGPLNEAAVPLRFALPVRSGMESITAAIQGKPFPVGTPVPVMDFSKALKERQEGCPCPFTGPCICP